MLNEDVVSWELMMMLRQDHGRTIERKLRSEILGGAARFVVGPAGAEQEVVVTPERIEVWSRRGHVTRIGLDAPDAIDRAIHAITDGPSGLALVRWQ
jgi:hypothetical protein